MRHKRPLWFCGVTTAPRKETTITKCIHSLQEAGWQPEVFAEPDSISGDWVEHRNECRLGIWYNWKKLAKAAISSRARYILSCQDDIVIHPETMDVLTDLFDRENYSQGILLPYTSSKYQFRFGIYEIKTTSLWGACCIAFPREVLQELMKVPIVKNWLGASPISYQLKYQRQQRENPHLVKNSDTAIGKGMLHLRRPIYMMNPSPAKHIAKYSTIENNKRVLDNSGPRNCLYEADFNKDLWEQLHDKKYHNELAKRISCPPRPRDVLN